jgi:hypothetical protein
MAVEQRLSYDVSFKEFSEWASHESWLCIHWEECDLGKMYSAVGKSYSFLTPNGNDVNVIVKDDKILTINQTISGHHRKAEVLIEKCQ